MVSKKDQDRIDRLFEDADNESDAGNYEACIAILDEIISIDPENAEAWHFYGFANNQLKRHEDAVSNLDKAIRLKHDYSRAYVERGIAKNELGQHEKAINNFNQAIQLDRKDRRAWHCLGTVKTQLGQFDEAIKDFDEAINIDANYDSAWDSRGTVKLQLGQYEEAIKDFDQATKLNPKDSNVWNNRGNAKLQLGKFEDAIKDFDEAIRLTPDFSEAWNSRGIAKVNLEQYEEAIKDFDEALRLKPKDESVAYHRAAARALLDVKKLLEKRLGTYDDATKNISEEIRKLEEDYQQLCRSRSRSLYFLFVVITTILALKFFSPLILPFVCSEIDLCSVISHEFENTGYFDTNLFSMAGFLTIITSLSIPILIKLRITSRDAEETKVLIQDYKRHLDLRALLGLWQSNFKPEKRNELFELLIKNAMTNSPVETLLKLKQKKLQQPNMHPLDDVLEACKNFVKGKDTPPQNP